MNAIRNGLLSGFARGFVARHNLAIHRNLVGEEIAARVAAKHGFSVGQLLGRRKPSALATARRELYAELRGIGWSYPMIGAFCGRDHGTVQHVLKGRPR